MAKKEEEGPLTMGEPAKGVKERTADEEIERILAEKAPPGEMPAAVAATESEETGA